MDTMYFSWLPSPVDYNKSLELPQFRLIDVLLVDCSKNYTTGSNKNTSGVQQLCRLAVSTGSILIGEWQIDF
jgi:hypothetical protein